MADTRLFDNITIAPSRSDWGGGGQGSPYHNVGVYAPTYTSASIEDPYRVVQISSVDCWSGATPITGTLSLSGSLLYWPYSVYYDGRSTPTRAYNNYFQLGLVVNNTGDPIPITTYTSEWLMANNQAGNQGTKIEQNWTGTANIVNATSIKLALLCSLRGEPNTWTNAELNGTINVAVFEPAVTDLPIYVRVGGNIKQVEKAYKRVGNDIKECDVYLRVGNDIKLIK